MNLQNVTTARATIAEISRLGQIANTPAGAELGEMASAADRLLAARTRAAPGFVVDRIEAAHNEVTRSGAAFPTDAELSAARIQLMSARFRLDHPVVGFVREHEIAAAATGLVGATALLTGGTALYLRAEDREHDRHGPSVDRLARDLVYVGDNRNDFRVDRKDTERYPAESRRDAKAVLDLPDTLEYSAWAGARPPLPADVRRLNDDGAITRDDAEKIIALYDHGPGKRETADRSLNAAEREHLRTDFARAGVPAEVLDALLRD